MFVLVQDIKSHFMVFVGVCNFKEEPLRIAVRVYVVLEKQVVLRVRNLRNERQVSRLKSGLENKSFIILIFQIIKGFYFFVF